MNQRTTMLALLATTLVITAAGLAIHAWLPSQIESNYFTVTPGNPLVIIFKVPDAGIQDHTLNLDMSISLDITSFENTIANRNVRNYTDFGIINESEYMQFANGKSLDTLVPVKSASDFSIQTYEDGLFLDVRIGFSFPANESTLYLILVSKNASMANEFLHYNAPRLICTIFYSILPRTYYIGYAIMVTGFAEFFVVLAFFFRGWKKWFIVGAGITTGVFLIRVGLLGFILEWPQIFTNTINVETYWDFQYQTLIWTSGYASGIPLYSTSMPIFYPFPPLYADTCLLFNLLPLPAWKMAIPLLAFNLLTGYLVFKIVMKLTSSEKRATISMMLYFLNPFTIMYASFSWLTTSAYLFFLISSFYLALCGKNSWAMVALGIGIGYKQYALAFFPLVVLAILFNQKKSGLKMTAWNLVKLTAICGGTIAVASVPFIITDPAGYLNNVFFAQAGGPGEIYFLSVLQENYSYPVTFNSFFLITGFPPAITNFIAELLAYNIPLITCALVIHLLYIRNCMRYSHQMQGEDFTRRIFAEALFWAMLMAFYLHVFYSRGEFKYYFVLLAPFLGIFYEAGDLGLRKAINGIPVKFGWKSLIPTFTSLIIVLLFRYDVPIIMLAWAIYLGIVRQFPVINNGFVENTFEHISEIKENGSLS